MTDIAEVTSAPSNEAGAGRKRKGSGLDSMVLPELKQLASTLGLKGTGAMRKGQLIDAIQSAQSRQGGQPPNGGDPAPRRDEATPAPLRTTMRRTCGATIRRPSGTMTTGAPARRRRQRPGRPAAERASRRAVNQPTLVSSQYPENGRAPGRAGRRRIPDRTPGRRVADRPRRRTGTVGRTTAGSAGRATATRTPTVAAATRAAAAKPTRPPAATTSRTSRTSNSLATGTRTAAAVGVGAGAAATGRTGATARGGNLERFDTEPVVAEDDVLVPARGILDVLDNYAFVRTSGYLPGPGGRVRLAVHGQEVRPAQGRRGHRSDPRSRARASARRSSTRWSGWRRSTAAIPSRRRTGSSSTS